MVFNLKNIQKAKTSIVIADIISAVILLLMLYTSLSKIIGYETFKFILKKSPLFHAFAGIIAIALPIGEITVALLLFIPATRLKGLYASFIMISVFTVYIIYMIVFSPDLPCSCGGVLKFLTWKQHIFFNIFFILLSTAGILFYRRIAGHLSKPPP